jgi:TonB family protein
MKFLLAILLLFVQTQPASDKWECRGDSHPLPKELLTRLTSRELKERVVVCAVPRLPGAFDGQGNVLVEVQVDETGNVRCARTLRPDENSIMSRAALDAMKQWKFRPVLVDGKAKPFSGILGVVVSWDAEKSNEQCSKEKRRD